MVLDAEYWRGPVGVSAVLESAALAAPVAIVFGVEIDATAAATTAIPFELGPLPSRLEGNVTVVATRGAKVASTTRRFSRAVPPDDYAGSVVVVDHVTKSFAHARGTLAGDTRAADRIGTLKAAGDAALARAAVARSLGEERDDLKGSSLRHLRTK